MERRTPVAGVEALVRVVVAVGLQRRQPPHHRTHRAPAALLRPSWLRPAAIVRRATCGGRAAATAPGRVVGIGTSLAPALSLLGRADGPAAALLARVLRPRRRLDAVDVDLAPADCGKDGRLRLVNVVERAPVDLLAVRLVYAKDAARA